MKFKLIVATLAMTIGSLASADVRPGTSIKASIDSNNRVELEQDLAELGIEKSRAETILTALSESVLTSDQLSQLLSVTDSSKQELVKAYVQDLLPSAVNASANNSSAASLMTVSANENSLSSDRKSEITKAAALIIQSKDNSTLNMDNMPAIMGILKQVADGDITAEVANSMLTAKDDQGKSLINLPEGEDALKALRDC